MKETVLDVLMYLFETAGEDGMPPEPNRDGLREELERAGFRFSHPDLEDALRYELGRLSADGPQIEFR